MRAFVRGTRTDVLAAVKCESHELSRNGSRAYFIYYRNSLHLLPRPLHSDTEDASASETLAFHGFKLGVGASEWSLVLDARA